MVEALQRAPEDRLVANFRSPEVEYGPIPLWWWDGDRMDKKRMTDQLETLKDQGVPMVCFIQKFPAGSPRGPQFEYFSEEWWEYMEYAVRECDRLGMKLWVHDETYHHSPPAKRYWQDHLEQMIPDNPELQGHILDRVSANVAGEERATLDCPDEMTVLAAAACPRRANGSLNVEAARDLEPNLRNGTLTWRAPGGNWHVSVIGYRPEGLCRTSRDVVERYLSLHYEEYARRLGDDLGDVLVGTFQDELFILEGTVPCDPTLLDRFTSEKGYDPVLHLIGLFENIGSETRQLRADYYDLVVSALEENWFRPLFDWHEEHGLQISHDNWGRNNMAQQTTQYGDYYRTMRWYQVPGYDDGGRIESIGTRNFFDAKLAASIAACYDRDRVWGELFHTTGWGISPQVLLAGIAENYCYGANLYDKHGLYYSTLGGWYEHAPPDSHFRQPYWEHSKTFNETVTRLSYLFSQGTPVVDAALLYPASSLHSRWEADEGVDEVGQQLDEETRRLSERMYESGTDLVFVDDESLQSAEVEAGEFRVSGMQIPTLVLGPSTTLHRETLHKIYDFYDRGGVVVAFDRLPDGSSDAGAQDEEMDTLLRSIFGARYSQAQTGKLKENVIQKNQNGGVGILVGGDAGDVTPLIDQFIERDIRTDESGIYHTHRSLGDREVYLFLNTRTERLDVTVDVRAEGRPERWDSRTGTVEQIHEYKQIDGRTRLNLSFAPLEFQVIVVRRGESSVRVTDTSLVEVNKLERIDPGIRVTGWTRTGGRPRVSVVADGQRWSAQGEAVSSASTHRLDEGWEFTLAPDLDNTWGDFRYQAGEEIIGSEVRTFRYHREDPETEGVALGWHQPDFENQEWEEYTWSYAPYLWRWSKTERGDDPPTPPRQGDTGDWEPYVFSERIGRPGTHPDDHGFDAIVSDHFLVASEEETTYFWTTAQPEEAGAVRVHYGPDVKQLWINGTAQIEGEEDAEKKSLVVGVDDGPMELMIAVRENAQTYLALTKPSEDPREFDMAYTPRVRWFYDDTGYSFDYRPWVEKPVCWYRFELPVGTRSFSLPVKGEARVWVDGTEHSIREGQVSLNPIRSEPLPVAVRAELPEGIYGGAAWTEPVQITTDPVVVDTGDWRELGLPSYSGLAVYRKVVPLPSYRPGDRVVLDLGEVDVSAAVAVNGTPVDTRIARPMRFDISEAVVPGKNEIEIEVANTVANHFESETPTRYVFEGQMSAGLHGPVTLEVQPSVDLTVDT